jgi:[ribosomal protein S5]-alanine N-acetyltransferase
LSEGQRLKDVILDMTEYPELVTARLRLRAFTMQDAPIVAQLCGEWEIAEKTANIPHPYDVSMAEEWIGSHPKAFVDGEAMTFAIIVTEHDLLVGAIGLHLSSVNRYAEVGYWIGKSFWNHGYATEATVAVIAYGFEKLGLNRIQARHMTKNPPSGRVMQKAGMKFEGILRQSIYRWEQFEDAAMYSILYEEYKNSQHNKSAGPSDFWRKEK